MRFGSWLEHMGVGLAAVVVAAGAETIVLSPVADTAIMEAAPQLNFGAQGDLPAGTLGGSANFTRSRILFKFDLAANIPANAIIHSALLALTVTRAPDGGGANSIFGLHRVLQAWGEGAKRGNPPGGAMAGPAEATWQMRLNPDQPWSVAGGQSGADYAETPSSTERVSDPGLYQFEFGGAGLAELREWLNSPSSNFGWMLISQSEELPKSARRFAAREHGVPEDRPRLTIEYSVETPARPVIRSISFRNVEVAITFSAEPGILYELQGRVAFDTGAWETLASIRAGAAARELTLTSPVAGSSQHCFQIMASR